MRISGPLLLILVVAGCGTRPSQPPPAPSPTAPAPSLPPVPLVTGRLAPKVVYPMANQLIQSRDSNFIFGSVGNGSATLTINGTPVKVLPNGSWIAWLPLPPRDRPAYDLVAVLGRDTARMTQPVRLLPSIVELPPTGPLVVDSASVAPAGGLALRDDEMVRVSVRAPANATVTWQGDSGAAAVLVSGAALATRTAAGDTVPLASVSTKYQGDPRSWATEVPARRLRAATRLVIARDSDTVRLAVAAVAPAPEPGTYGMLGADTSIVSDTDRVIIGRPVPGGTYKWLLMAGTVMPVTGRSGDFVRVRLDDALEIWVKSADIRLLPRGYAPVPRVAGNARLVPGPAFTDLEIPMSTRPPFLVEEGPRELVLTLYGVHGNTDIIDYVGNDSLVRVVRWEPVGTARVRYTLRLANAPYGYLAFWRDGRFVLRVRRPPVVNPSRPLAGLTIAVDAGHPPIGATGPTGLWEPVATLAVAEQLRTMLEARGATVVMTRLTPAPVPLGDRPITARRANANALVSIHLNALPDGIDPFTAFGTGAYFFHPQSEPLARALQVGMVRRMGLPNLGVHYDNLALARPTWMPAVLCEGAFIMMPDEEAALRTPEFQSAYARGIADGLERYFRSLAAPE